MLWTHPSFPECPTDVYHWGMQCATIKISQPAHASPLFSLCGCKLLFGGDICTSLLGPAFKLTCCAKPEALLGGGAAPDDPPSSGPLASAGNKKE